jgi:hypothetical protein
LHSMSLSELLLITRCRFIKIYPYREDFVKNKIVLSSFGEGLLLE